MARIKISHKTKLIIDLFNTIQRLPRQGCDPLSATQIMSANCSIKESLKIATVHFQVLTIKIDDQYLFMLEMPEFFEAIWHGDGIGDGGDLEEALQSFAVVKPEDGNWEEACSAKGADPHIERFTSFEDYLDNNDALETIPVTPKMITDAIE